MASLKLQSTKWNFAGGKPQHKNIFRTSSNSAEWMGMGGSLKVSPPIPVLSFCFFPTLFTHHSCVEHSWKTRQSLRTPHPAKENIYLHHLSTLVETSTTMMMTTYFPVAAQSQSPQRQRWRCRRREEACLGLTWIKKKSKHSSDYENYVKDAGDDDGDYDRQPKPTKRGLLLVGGRGSQKR